LQTESGPGELSEQTALDGAIQSCLCTVLQLLGARWGLH